MPRSRPNISALVFSLASDLAQFLRSAFRSRTALVAENLFLRKQLAFYREHKVRPRPLTDAARLSLVLWSRLFEWKNALMIVRPGTFTGWHRKGFKLFWRWKSRPGRPPLPQEITPYLKVLAAEAGQALQVLDRFHITTHLNQAVDRVRRGESTRLRAVSQQKVGTITKPIPAAQPPPAPPNEDDYIVYDNDDG